MDLRKPLYECHVTVQRPEDLTMYDAIAKELRWKTSYIKGDPVLGDDKSFFYFTCHGVDYEVVKEKMFALRDRLGTVIRLKIEQIVFDTKAQGGAYVAG